MERIITLLAIVVTLNASAYCDRGITASGEPVRKGICAMDKAYEQEITTVKMEEYKGNEMPKV